MNSAVGAAVILLLFFLPFAPMLGGAVAGYLEGGDGRNGGKAGVFAALLSLIPLYLVALFVVPVIILAPFGVPFVPGNAIVFSMALFLLVSLYLMLFAAIGGFLGAYLQETAD